MDFKKWEKNIILITRYKKKFANSRDDWKNKLKNEKV